MNSVFLTRRAMLSGGTLLGLGARLHHTERIGIGFRGGF